jgi:hypothetical protein
LPGVVVSNQSPGPADHAAWRDIHRPFIARPGFDAHHKMVIMLIIYNRLFSLDRIKAQNSVPENDEFSRTAAVWAPASLPIRSGICDRHETGEACEEPY